MAKTYTRVYSPRSASHLASGKGPNGPPLTNAELEEEFRNHSDIWNTEPTALVSVSDRIIDTVRRAFNKYYVDGEPPGTIWIAFIEVPSDVPNQPHRAEHLAELTGHSTPKKLTHEWLFEWHIPTAYVSHQVSLQTLMGRKLDWKKYVSENASGTRSLLSTSDIQASIAQNFLPSDWRVDPWEIGLEAGFFATAFGARSPVDWIAHQYFYDCAHPKKRFEGVVELKLGGADPKTVDYLFLRYIDDGIDTAIMDFWLTSVAFEEDYARFKRWRDRLRAMKTGDGHIEAAIEAYAVEIGL